MTQLFVSSRHLFIPKFTFKHFTITKNENLVENVTTEKDDVMQENVRWL